MLKRLYYTIFMYIITAYNGIDNRISPASHKGISVAGGKRLPPINILNHYKSQDKQ
jgi:hypothetical protein